MVISRSVFVAAPVERVFSVLADPATRAALNPNATPLRVEVEDARPLHEGSVCHYRLQMGNRIIDYRTRVAAFQPNKRIVAVSASTIPFEITVTTDPEGDGTLLTQEESFEATDEMLQETVPTDEPKPLSALMSGLLLSLDVDAMIERRNQQERALQKKLEKNLENWLIAIKGHVEKGTGAQTPTEQTPRD